MTYVECLTPRQTRDTKVCRDYVRIQDATMSKKRQPVMSWLKYGRVVTSV